MLMLGVTLATAQQKSIAGRVVDAETGSAIEFATILLSESGLWAVTNAKGSYTINGVPAGADVMTVQCLGYMKHSQSINIGSSNNSITINVRLQPTTLKVDEVTVTAHRKNDEATTSYTIDRHALDQQQLLNLSDITVLLPGGKTVNPTMMNDSRMALRSGSQEMGNASFGTAVEIDGLRLDNNAAASETAGASTRTVSSSDVESVDIVTGIPSVEYGDLSNGIVKVRTRQGKSPFIIEGKLNQHTRQVALNKGIALSSGKGSEANLGVMNIAVEHARSFSDAASPHTAYQRNVLSLRYTNTFMQQSGTPLSLSLSMTGNIGGYNSEADPDEELDDYTKARDNALRSQLNVQWLLNKPWITNVQLQASLSIKDQKQTSYTHTSSASTQPYLHATHEGYYMAQLLTGTQAAATDIPDIVLGPTGYWYVKSFHDSKPITWSMKLKAEENARFNVFDTQWRSHLMAGLQWSGSRNAGRGTYYDDIGVAPTWREYRYDRLPAMSNLAPFIEEKLIIPLTSHHSPHTSHHSPLTSQASLELTGGVRSDFTMIGGSDYGTVSSLSPRFNGRLILWRNMKERLVSDLQLHGGWGRSVKLPSMQVLYPTPSYSDLLCFASTSTADNTSYYAYHTQPIQAQYNSALQWQYTNQTDVGVELTVKGTRISLSAFHHKTSRSYMSARRYTPFTYRYTGQTAVQQSGIDAANRVFSIDQRTGTVTVGDAIGQQPSRELTYTDRNTYITNQYYTNADPADRYGVEWIVDFAQWRTLHTSLRIDGSYYRYKGVSDVLFADVPLGVSNIMSDGQPYQYVGYYRGASVTTAGSSANATVSNGATCRQLNLNTTLTTHIPQLRLVMALRIESTLHNYRRALSELSDGTLRGYMLNEAGEYFGEPYDPSARDRHVVVYPDYYTTWANPTEMLPFAERFQWARDNDRQLYNDLSRLVVRSNFAYTLNPNRLSSYYSANFSVTKEIGDHISLSFYANNFLNNMRRVRSSQTGLETSLFESSYIPNYYYGLSMRLKI